MMGIVCAGGVKKIIRLAAGGEAGETTGKEKEKESLSTFPERK